MTFEMDEMERVVWEGWFSLIVPANWLYRQEGDIIAIFNEFGGVGVIQISCVRRDKVPAPELTEAINLAEMFARERGWKLQRREVVSYRIDNCPVSEFTFIERDDEPTFWQVWHIVEEKRMAFITYNCSLIDAEIESEMRQKIIKSFKWEYPSRA